MDFKLEGTTINVSFYDLSVDAQKKSLYALSDKS